MAVTIYMPDGTIKVLGAGTGNTAPAKTTPRSVAERRKSMPSNGARTLKQALDRLDDIDQLTKQRKDTVK
jgi:hypothetical protein